LAPSLGAPGLRRAVVLRPGRELSAHARTARGLDRGPPCAPDRRRPLARGWIMSGAGVPVAALPPAGERGLPRAFRRPWSPLWIAFVSWQWWDELVRRFASAGAADLPERGI